MKDDSMSPREIIISCMIAVVPERKEEIEHLWEKYDPEVALTKTKVGIHIQAEDKKIEIDPKVFEVFWLICFSGWKAIECYTPAVICSASGVATCQFTLQNDENLGEFEREYKERMQVVQALINADNASEVAWPDGVPRPASDRSAFEGEQDKVRFDLSLFAATYVLFHEFRHVILGQEKERPSDLREEEVNCDVWARDFVTAKLEKYAEENNHSYQDVLRKRAMGASMFALILHEITPFLVQGGSSQYFSVRDRLTAIVANTPLPDNDSFWNFTASILVGICRQKHIPIDVPCCSAKDLARELLKLI